MRCCAERSFRWASLLALPTLAYLAIFYFYPLASILAVSFARSVAGPGAAVAAVLASPVYQKIVGFTFFQATVSTLLTLAVGLPGAYLLARFRFPGQSLLRALTAVPFVLPTLVVAAGFNALLGARGWVNLGLMGVFGLAAPPIAFLNTFGAILIAHVFYNTTIVLRLGGARAGRLAGQDVLARDAAPAGPGHCRGGAAGLHF